MLLKEFTRLTKKTSALIYPQNKSSKPQEEISVLMRNSSIPEQKKSKGDSSTVEEEDYISTTWIRWWIQWVPVCWRTAEDLCSRFARITWGNLGQWGSKRAVLPDFCKVPYSRCAVKTCGLQTVPLDNKKITLHSNLFEDLLSQGRSLLRFLRSPQEQRGLWALPSPSLFLHSFLNGQANPWLLLCRLANHSEETLQETLQMREGGMESITQWILLSSPAFVASSCSWITTEQQLTAGL